MRTILIATMGMALWAQTEAPKPGAGRVIGEVTARDSDGKLTVKSDAGGAYTVTGDEKTRYLRVPLGEKDIKNAARIAAADVKVGDRVIARGAVDEAAKSVVVSSLVVMTKEDLTVKSQHEQEDWQKRGVTGTVKTVTPDFVVAVRSRDGETAYTVMPGAATKISRYAPDSVNFRDAKPAQLSDIAPGDVARVLGNKSDDGKQIQAEQIVAGTFRTIGGTVVSVDADKNQMVVRDAETKQPVTVLLTPDTQLRKLSPMAANMLARRLNPSFQAAAGAGGPGGQGGQAGQAGVQRGGGPDAGGPGGFQRGPGATGQPGGPPRGGPGGTGGAGGMDQMLGRLPAFELKELTPGEALMISTSARAGSSTAHAIAVLSGAEPVLRAVPAGSMNLGSWNMELGGGAQ